MKIKQEHEVKEESYWGGSPGQLKGGIHVYNQNTQKVQNFQKNKLSVNLYLYSNIDIDIQYSYLLLL